MILARRTRHVPRSFRNTRVNSAGVVAKSNFGEESRAPSAGGSDKRHTSGAIAHMGLLTFAADRDSRGTKKIDCSRERFFRKNPMEPTMARLVVRARDLWKSSDSAAGG